MNIKDIELTVKGNKGYAHTITKAKPRLTDGLRHPVIIIKGR